ncbi:DUF2092 domain-containing protein [Shimia thalassica]|uniref:DUF2092 domain-containing protein n=1 Tax=Shimia thalassica TaxID=1715693 RepID=UPI002736D0A3|nr:DUF2092 domain-containing protein [Shimia thalassica]MDP2493936.1 DUF2092 domain-containing protein [Shimia thalassica]
MTLVRSTLTGCFFAVSLVGIGQTEEAPKIDPIAAETIERAGALLAQAENISVRWFVAYDEILDGREKLTHMRSGFSLLSREDGYYAHVVDGLDTREMYFDGTTLAIHDVEKDAYVQAYIPGDYEELIDRADQEYGLEIPIWSVLSKRYQGQYLEDAETAAYIGLTRVGAQLAHHVALSNYDEDWQVWISADDDNPELLMLVGTDPYTQGWPQYRVYFSDWDMNPEIEEGAFSFQPGENSERMVWPKSPDQ